MQPLAIFIPFTGMLVLTMLVWFYMFYLRLGRRAKEPRRSRCLSTARGRRVE
jgi:hypothetical protein